MDLSWISLRFGCIISLYLSNEIWGEPIHTFQMLGTGQYNLIQIYPETQQQPITLYKKASPPPNPSFIFSGLPLMDKYDNGKLHRE
jgi:hypothetical protein